MDSVYFGNMAPTNTHNDTAGRLTRLKEIAFSCLKLGSIGFGGIAGMVSTIENEMVIKRQWLDHQHFMDVVSASYIIPGPNAVEIVMHCGKERGGRLGLVVAGICYILPAMLICLLFGYFYQRYSALPDVQNFIFGLRPATTALVITTVFRLTGKTLKNSRTLIVLCLLVFAGSLAGLNEVLLIIGAGLINYLLYTRRKKISFFIGWMFTPLLLQINTRFSNEKLVLIFLKIGAVLYGSGYVLFAYMDEALVRNNHWLTRQQLMDAIAVGQITPGPILSSATFAGYLINGFTGGVLATIAIFLPSFFISFFLHKMLSSARKSERLRVFLDGLSAASVSIIAAVGLHLLTASVETWRGALVLASCLGLSLAYKNLSTVYIILIGSIGGFLLLKL
ncbi:chromate transporter, chromate ion transporter (CHR) family [Niastella koreensis GR20-10]|uniref:Chromate transporter, chromate ion transporter (CHR) family n=2 Tax=Niastella koreensis TaxID=354356 RepID=G8TAP9_NIAKG|nr:chromate transporter, chromate ion transporter (CHR) family [Niastella koreensis GR20-10]